MTIAKNDVLEWELGGEKRGGRVVEVSDYETEISGVEFESKLVVETVDGTTELFGYDGEVYDVEVGRDPTCIQLDVEVVDSQEFEYNIGKKDIESDVEYDVENEWEYQGEQYKRVCVDAPELPFQLYMRVRSGTVEYCHQSPVMAQMVNHNESGEQYHLPQNYTTFESIVPCRSEEFSVLVRVGQEVAVETNKIEQKRTVYVSGMYTDDEFTTELDIVFWDGVNGDLEEGDIAYITDCSFDSFRGERYISTSDFSDVYKLDVGDRDLREIIEGYKSEIERVL